MRYEALEPRELVVELGPGLGVAIWKVDRRHDQAPDRSFQIPGLRIGGITRQTAPNLARRLISREDRHPVVRTLSVPHGAVSRVGEGTRRKFGVVGLELLQADHIRARFCKPFEQARQAAVDPVDVVCGDSHVGFDDGSGGSECRMRETASSGLRS